MSAVGNTSRSQFGWIEDTKRDIGPGLDEGTARLHYVDRNTLGPGSEPGQTFGDSHAEVVAKWRHEAPRPYTADEVRFEEDQERDWSGNAQGRLVTKGVDKGPMLIGLASTERGRFASARGVGMMANLIEERLGKTITPSTSLSAQSAPLVSKLTGEHHPQTNDILFDETPERRRVPDEGTLPRSVKPSRIKDAERHATFQWMDDDAAKAGGQRLQSHMRSMRLKPEGSHPDTATYQQEQLFQPSGPSANARTTDLKRELKKRVIARRQARR